MIPTQPQTAEQRAAAQRAAFEIQARWLAGRVVRGLRLLADPAMIDAECALSVSPAMHAEVMRVIASQRLPSSPPARG